MGRCWRCDTELRLNGNEWLCDNCNEPCPFIKFMIVNKEDEDGETEEE